MRRDVDSTSSNYKPAVLGITIAEVEKSFCELETLRKKGPLTGLPEWLITVEDVRAIVKYNCFRARITLVARCNVEIRVPFTLVREVAGDIERRKLFGTAVRVYPLGFWDHVLLWRIHVRSLIPVNPIRTG